MNLGNYGEILVYALTAALAVSAGLVVGMSSSTTHRRGGSIANLLIIGVVVVGGFVLGAAAPWIGPIFAFVAIATGILAMAAAKGDDPNFKDASFGNRVVAVFASRRIGTVEDVSPQHAER